MDIASLTLPKLEPFQQHTNGKRLHMLRSTGRQTVWPPNADDDVLASRPMAVRVAPSFEQALVYLTANSCLELKAFPLHLTGRHPGSDARRFRQLLSLPPGIAKQKSGTA